MAWADVFHLGARQLGVVTPSCARRCDIRTSRLVARADAERWSRPVPGAFVLPGWAVDGRTRLVARALLAGDAAVVTGHSALALHGLLRTPPTRTDLLVPHNHRRPVGPGTVTRWTRALPRDAVVTRYGVTITDVARSLSEVAAVTDLPHLRAIALDALHRDQLALGELDRELGARTRFAGRGRYRQLRADLEGDGSESGFEFDTRVRLATLGLAPDAEQATVVTADGNRRIDLPYRDARVGVECLGFAYHSRPDDLDRDARRSNAIAVADRWLLLRLTFRMFHTDFDGFVGQLRTALATRRGHR